MTDDEYLDLALTNYMACAYNAAVNYGANASDEAGWKELSGRNGRGHRKMWDLVRAINTYERVKGRIQLSRLVADGVIDGFNPCPTDCEVRPGGLFHAEGCENDWNHEVSKHRRELVEQLLPVARKWDASPKLVGSGDD